MKLRNKKTGEVQICEAITVQTDIRIDDYTSLAELNEDWEDYKPKEPLVGDDDERELVSKWASLYCIQRVTARRRTASMTIELADFDDQSRILAIDAYTTITDGDYTIAELCGEEEE